jgi:hypothetical protein
VVQDLDPSSVQAEGEGEVVQQVRPAEAAWAEGEGEVVQAHPAESAWAEGEGE